MAAELIGIPAVNWWLRAAVSDLSFDPFRKMVMTLDPVTYDAVTSASKLGVWIEQPHIPSWGTAEVIRCPEFPPGGWVLTGPGGECISGGVLTDSQLDAFRGKVTAGG